MTMEEGVRRLGKTFQRGYTLFLEIKEIGLGRNPKISTDKVSVLWDGSFSESLNSTDGYNFLSSKDYN